MAGRTDKEAALLGNLSRTLGKLMELEGGRPAGTPESKDMQDLRNKLAKRIDQLKRN